MGPWNIKVNWPPLKLSENFVSRNKIRFSFGKSSSNSSSNSISISSSLVE